jgi:hypothetical protein
LQVAIHSFLHPSVCVMYYFEPTIADLVHLGEIFCVPFYNVAQQHDCDPG